MDPQNNIYNTRDFKEVINNLKVQNGKMKNYINSIEHSKEHLPQQESMVSNMWRVLMDTIGCASHR